MNIAFFGASSQIAKGLIKKFAKQKTNKLFFLLEIDNYFLNGFQTKNFISITRKLNYMMTYQKIFMLIYLSTVLAQEIQRRQKIWVQLLSLLLRNMMSKS